MLQLLVSWFDPSCILINQIFPKDLGNIAEIVALRRHPLEIRLNKMALDQIIEKWSREIHYSCFHCGYFDCGWMMEN